MIRTSREVIENALQTVAHLRVLAPNVAEQVESPTAMCNVDSVEYDPAGCAYVVSVQVVVVVPKTAPGDGDDQVDDACDDALNALRADGHIFVSSVRRGTYRDLFPAYIITAQVHTA